MKLKKYSWKAKYWIRTSSVSCKSIFEFKSLTSAENYRREFYAGNINNEETFRLILFKVYLLSYWKRISQL